MSHSPAGTVRRAYSRPVSPKTEDGESIRKDRSLDNSREDLSDGSTGGTNRGAPRPHVPRAPPPVLEREFRGDKQQEPPEDLGYDIKLEEPNGRETRRVEGMNGVRRLGGDTQEFHGLQHPLQETQAGRRMREIEAMLQKIPSK